jgi:diacylglycerol kinase (ATP)
MGKPGNNGFRRILHAARYSAQGLKHAWKHEAAFRQEVGITLFLVPFALWLGTTPVERWLLIASCLFVLIVELLNSAVEATIDRFGGERHELSGRAKDMGSAAVFISLAMVVITWTTIGWQRFA